MRALDVFAITSIHEGFGLVLAEAMAAQRPVVATRAGAIPEVVLHEETGLLTDIGDVEALARAFARMTDPAFRARLGAAGHRRVLDHFTLERMWQQTDDLYARYARAASTRTAPAQTPAALLS
jgi:glycosyltransferase involved in cell wall biosynthesis